MPTQGVRTGYLAELETLARRLPYPLDAVESDGSLRIVPSFEALTCADVCEHRRAFEKQDAEKRAQRQAKEDSFARAKQRDAAPAKPEEPPARKGWGWPWS